MNYYNEFDPGAANWIESLIDRGLIPPGEVDRRSIVEVTPGDLEGFTQCHFFAGIAGWSFALELAGWPEDLPVWTGSCPCQPFSVAIVGKGTHDERHLWPEFYRLVAERKPAIIFGEQVASQGGLRWVDHVQADLEEGDYAFGAAVLPACGIGAPHIRSRLFWGAERMADTLNEGSQGRLCWRPDPQREVVDRRTGCDSPDSGRSETNGYWSDPDWIRCRDGNWRAVESGTSPLAYDVSGKVVQLKGYGNAIVPPLAAEFVKAFEEARR